jgi:hypothetical protein
MMRGRGVYREAGEYQRNERTASEGKVEGRGREMRPAKERNISQALFQIPITIASSGSSHSHSLSLSCDTIAIRAVYLPPTATGIYCHHLSVQSSHLRAQ